MEEVWVTFEENIFSILKETGYKYFVFIAIGEENKLYPFMTLGEAQWKQKENKHLPLMNNYIMDIDKPLIELSKGVALLDVKVLI